MIPDLWTEIDFPALQAVAVWEVKSPPDKPALSLGELTALLQLDIENVPSVGAAVSRLVRGGFLEATAVVEETGYPMFAERLTPKGLRCVGAWPTTERFVESLAAAFDDAAIRMGPREPERAARLKEVSSWLGGGARDLAADLLARLVAHAAGLP